jgi:hypothetical protein
MKSIISLFLALAAFSAAIASPPTTRDLPVVGSIETTDDVDVIFPTLTSTVDGAGQASQLGRYAFLMQVEVDLITDTSTGTFSIEAANGDQLTGTVTGIGADTIEENVFLLTELLTIEGGTGRFEGASGTITLVRVANAVTQLGVGTLEGTVSVPGNSGHTP